MQDLTPIPTNQKRKSNNARLDPNSELKSVLTRAGINHDGPEIGPEIAEFFEKDFPSPGSTPKDGKLDRIWQELKEGKSFWEVVKEPFMKRNICRDDVKVIIQRALKESFGQHMKDTLPIFNIPTQELKKLLDFTYDYRIMQFNSEPTPSDSEPVPN